MDEITKNLSSLAWWFTAVLVGVFVSLAANYLKPATDRAIAYALQKLSERIRTAKESQTKLLEKLNSDRDFREFIFQGELRAYIASFFYGLSGVIALAMFVLVRYAPEFAELEDKAIYLGVVSALCMYMCAMKFFDGVYLGRGLIMAAKDKFKVDEL